VVPWVLFAGGIYKTMDTGATWRLVYAFQGNSPFNRAGLAINAGNHLRLAATVPGTGALILTLDGGTWSATANIGSTLTADPTGSGSLISGGNLSRDWGLTLQRLMPPGRGSFTVAFDLSHPRWIYADVAAGTQGSLWLSTDFGATWAAKASPNDAFSAFYSPAVDPGNPNVLLGLTPDGLFVSGDGAGSEGGLYTVTGTGLQAGSVSVTLDDLPVPVVQAASGGTVVQMPPS
jgi:hypothetical protein